MRLGILVSGRGSNLEAVLQAVADGRLAGIEPALVVSNRSGVRALDVAAGHGVTTRVLRTADFGDDRALRDVAIGQALADASVHLALLAGFDQVLAPGYFTAYRGLTINIHPSLLPRYGGPGMVGRRVHAAVVAAGEAETGVTVHEVTLQPDAGPILAQARVPVERGDDASRLAARVLAEEHRLLVATLRELATTAFVGTASATMTAASAASQGAEMPITRPIPHA